MEFVPLPARWFNIAQNSLVTQFEKCYNGYRANIVKPMFSTLKNCNGLVIMLDIANIIQNGPLLYNDYVQMITNIFDALKPTSGIVPSLISKTTGFCNLRRVAFVASQCDRFHSNDWDCLEGLAKGFTTPIQRSFPNAKCETFACSSVLSAVDSAGEPGVIVQLKNAVNNKGIGLSVYQLNGDESPFRRGGWPNTWKKEGISIPKIAPYMPEIQNAVPEHHKLNEVFRYVTGWF